MEILVRAGDREPQSYDRYAYSLRDGMVLKFRPDNYFTGKDYGYNLIRLRVSANYATLLAQDDMNHVLSSFTIPTYKNKYPWEQFAIRDWQESTPASPKLSRRRDWFVDFEWLRLNGYITEAQYKSIYNFDERTAPIDLGSVDFTQIIRHEDSYTRLKPFIKNNAWSSGDKTVGSSGADYTDWSDAVDAMDSPMSGNATIKGNAAESRTETNSVTFDNNLNGYSLVIGVVDGYKHTGNFGTGHRINWTTSYTYCLYMNASTGYQNGLVIQDLELSCSNTNNGLIFLRAGSTTSGNPIIQRNMVDGNGYSNVTGILVYYDGVERAIIRNNVVVSCLNGINGDPSYSSTRIWRIYNNTITKCTGTGLNISSATGTMYIYNNLTQGNTTDCGGTANWDNHDKNVSEDSSSPDDSYDDTNCHDATSCFVDYTNDDYDLASGGTEMSLLDDGDDLSAIGSPQQFSDDIVGRTRSTWYIGAFEYVSGGISATVSASLAAITGSDTYKVLVKETVTSTLAQLTANVTANTVSARSALVAAQLTALTSEVRERVLVQANAAATLSPLVSSIQEAVLVKANVAGSLTAIVANVTAGLGEIRSASITATLAAVTASVNEAVEVSGSVTGTLTALTSNVTDKVRVSSAVAGALAELTALEDIRVRVASQVAAQVSPITGRIYVNTGVGFANDTGYMSTLFGSVILGD